MANRLFIFGRLAHDAKGVLAAVYRLANMLIELVVNRLRGILHGKFFTARNLELLIAIKTHPQIGSRPNSLDDFQFTFLHRSMISCV